MNTLPAPGLAERAAIVALHITGPRISPSQRIGRDVVETASDRSTLGTSSRRASASGDAATATARIWRAFGIRRPTRTLAHSTASNGWPKRRHSRARPDGGATTDASDMVSSERDVDA